MTPSADCTGHIPPGGGLNPPLFLRMDSGRFSSMPGLFAPPPQLARPARLSRAHEDTAFIRACQAGREKLVSNTAAMLPPR